MVPFSGFEEHSLAPVLTRLGAFVYRHGEHFYNFQGLRQFKEKFNPVWEPKYLASPGGFALPQVFFNLSGLISGGVKGLVAK
jgi:phosphatidylglycerol lysyltransferase